MLRHQVKIQNRAVQGNYPTVNAFSCTLRLVLFTVTWCKGVGLILMVYPPDQGLLQSRHRYTTFTICLRSLDVKADVVQNVTYSEHAS